MDLQTQLSQILSDPATVRSTEPAVDEMFMRRALDLAWRGAGRTHPNPMVGAVVVSGGMVVGEGFHARCGHAHGEVAALDAAGERARGATIYVTLEPCAHHGRTPPCVARILESGVRRVVIPTLDPDKRVFGRGVEALRAGGVRVEVGCLPGPAVALNLGYYRNRLGLAQTVTLKMASTMDGKIASAPGRRDDITGAAARRMVHAMRALHDCVVVGVDTVRVDNPRLDCRLADTDPQQPLRLPVPVVLDTGLRLPPGNRWAVEERPYIVVAGPDAPSGRARALEATGARVLRCPAAAGGAGVSVRGALDALHAAGLERILVEGGAGVFTSFVESGCWDAFYLFQSTKLFGEGAVPLMRASRASRGDIIDGLLVDSTDVGGDILHRFLSARSWETVMRPVNEGRKGE